MSQQITTAHVQQYATTITMQAQQLRSRLAQTVDRREGVVGRRASFDQIGLAEAIEKTTRHGDTPLVETPHSRRWATLSTWVWADLIDDDDVVRLLTNPQSKYVVAGSAAMGRRMDRLILGAVTSASPSGQEGAGSVAFPAAQQVAVNYVESGAAAASNLTIGKIRRAKELMDAAEVDEEGRVFTYTANQLHALLRDTQVTSSDFNTVKALVAGELNTYLGFEFKRIELLPKAGNNRSNYAYQKFGLGFAVGQEIKTRVAERADKNFATQVWFQMTLGAVRVEEVRTVEILCDETL